MEDVSEREREEETGERAGGDGEGIHGACLELVEGALKSLFKVHSLHKNHQQG